MTPRVIQSQKPKPPARRAVIRILCILGIGVMATLLAQNPDVTYYVRRSFSGHVARTFGGEIVAKQWVNDIVDGGEAEASHSRRFLSRGHRSETLESAGGG
jgi:hypothetical protein